MFTWKSIQNKVLQAVHAAGQMLYGMTTFEWAKSALRERREFERLFMLLTFGDLIGLPILPPYYTWRLLPFVIPTLHGWKRSLARERDWTDLVDLIEGVD